MKRFTALFAVLLACATAAHATVTIEIQAGVLRTFSGAVIPDGTGLLQLITSPSGTATFGAPTSTSFVTGDNVVLASYAMNSNTGTPGVTDNTFTLTLQNTSTPVSATAFDQGDSLLLRWYPTLTTSSTAPGVGARYGEFRTNSTADGGNPWVAPADGGTAFLVLYTNSIGGSQPDTAGYASNTVQVPEPGSIVAIFVMGAGVAGIYARRRKF